MPMPSDPQAAALVQHIITQTQQNISFLASHDYISAVDAADMTSRLTAPHNNGALVDGMQSMALTAPSGRRIPPPPPRVQHKARALWAYNENGQEPNDLSFSAEEIIEIVDETNADWWTGKCRGRQGLFPSNHVEKIQSSASPPPPFSSAPVPPMPSMPMAPMPMAPMPPQPSYVPNAPEKPIYRPFGAVNQAADMSPPTGVNSVGLQQAPQPEHKKSKFGKLGNTMANSAAGGVGFGAGAAIGSGIVNAIF
ncbi:hypothetical protein AcW1_008505 [Taiwanofungus camphoratus]|nr:hypothetical protein AcV5_008795 [Antrodia cinnamomea]KAI0951468.1 hypothetical protein AcW1_008505 [Antrodia cinnamomea]KAI0956369.1 hypothetical protein AcV7_006791 [Antrodia cinnamomea]